VKCLDCTKVNIEECFFCYSCSKHKHDHLEVETGAKHKLHKLSFAEIKMIMEKPYLAHEIVPVSQRSLISKSKAYLRGDSLLDVKSEYQRVKENVRKSSCPELMLV